MTPEAVNPPAFPCEAIGDRSVPPEHDFIQVGIHSAKFPGMTLRDWFAAFAPQPSDDLVSSHERVDIARNPHNDSYKPRRRTRAEIAAQLRYEFADAMLAARQEQRK